ncbi:hypothetical protein PHMEG_00016137 [Phytophthora megakarya]|uniref:Uncharacterized protein n=1 Tax=Phytophthora megakarya TaxID=4795 RepID=A0A225VZI9_9STRA|nr:hypothetical protein PHMEG_00016137 [Phytophthora megakarya]
MLTQVSNCAKYLRCRQGANKYVRVGQQLVRLTALGDLIYCNRHSPHRICTPTPFKIFIASATFKLSDLDYPVITGGLLDASRSYQLAAIFMVSRCTDKSYAQLNEFQQVPMDLQLSSCAYFMCSTMYRNEPGTCMGNHKGNSANSLCCSMNTYYSIKDTVFGEWGVIPR